MTGFVFCCAMYMDRSSLTRGPSSSSSPSLLAKGLSLETSCAPCGHQGALDADAPQQLSSDPGPSSFSSDPASLERGAELTVRRGSANGLLQSPRSPPTSSSRRGCRGPAPGFQISPSPHPRPAGPSLQTPGGAGLRPVALMAPTPPPASCHSSRSLSGEF
ncbi:Condensin complex subunit capg-1 [Dissostichus eleginoides]|uniref:Condensin complex subunit capg-1 n=1 Tax=Dissostichus eleginoides TaxID=100907 RepID=A0AAD9CBK4_DISEL|nr:Condensin complex subunit capg-1 [Dissostichus eleginoides]